MPERFWERGGKKHGKSKVRILKKKKNNKASAQNLDLCPVSTHPAEAQERKGRRRPPAVCGNRGAGLPVLRRRGSGRNEPPKAMCFSPPPGPARPASRRSTERTGSRGGEEEGRTARRGAGPPFSALGTPGAFGACLFSAMELLLIPGVSAHLQSPRPTGRVPRGLAPAPLLTALCGPCFAPQWQPPRAIGPLQAGPGSSDLPP